MTVSKKAKQKQKQKQKLASGVNETASSVSHATAEQQVGFPEILPGTRNASSEVCMQTQKSGTYNSQSRHALAAFWDSIPAEKQLQLLTFDLNLLRARAYYVPDQPKLGEALDIGVTRLRETGKFRQWELTTGAGAFDSALFLRSALHGLMMTQEISQEMKDKMSPPNIRPASSHARQRLRKQLEGVQHKMLAAKQARKDLARAKPWRLTKQSYLMDAVLTELLSGHQLLYSVIADPIAQTLWEAPPFSAHSSRPAADKPSFKTLDFGLLDRAGHDNLVDIAQVNDWVETKISNFCRLAEHGADYRQEVPPLTLTSSKAGATLAVSEQWLQKLEKLYQAESSTSTESPPESGSGCRLASGNALLHWVFDWEPVSPCTPTLPGTTASKTPADAAYEQMRSSQEEVAAVATRTDQIEELINEMKHDINLSCNLSTHHESRFRHGQKLPLERMESVLQQEFHVCKADICCTGYKVFLGSVRLFKLGQRLGQAQAQHRHLKIIEQAIRHHGMSMVHDDPASNDHRRMHVGMAMVHEHEMNARVLQDLERNMQVLTAQRDAAERDQAKLKQELQKCKDWGDQIAHLVTALADLSQYFEKYAASRPAGLGVSLPEQTLRQLSDHFHQELQGKLCTPERQAELLKALGTQHKLMLQHLDEGCAVLELLQHQVVDAACDDPAALILPHLVMPLIRDRLETKALVPKADPRCTPSWDPRWAALAEHYRWNCFTEWHAVASFDADITMLQKHLVSMYEDRDKQSSTEMHMTFVDDLLLVQYNCASSEVELLGGTILGDMTPTRACLAALFFLS